MHSFACYLATPFQWQLLTLFPSSQLCFPSPNAVSLLPTLFLPTLFLLQQFVPASQQVNRCHTVVAVALLQTARCGIRCRSYTQCMCVCCVCHIIFDGTMGRKTTQYRPTLIGLSSTTTAPMTVKNPPRTHVARVCVCASVCVCQADNLSWVRRNRESCTAVNIPNDAT